MSLTYDESVEAYIDTPKTLDFYKRGFAKYTASGVDQFAWHWSWWAMFGGVFYLLYRKLYMEAFIYFVAFATVGMIPIVGLILWAVSGAVLPFLVYKRYKKTMDQVEENLSTKEEQLQALRTIGGVNKWAIWLAVVIHILMWIALFYAVFVLSTMRWNH